MVFLQKKWFILLLIPLIFISANSQSFSGYKVFVWDNDYGLTLTNPDNSYDISYDYNIMHACSLLGFRRSTGNLEKNTILPPLSYLEGFAVLFVANGPRAASQEIFTSAQITTMAQYLENGGCIYMEGNNIADFLVNYNSSAYRGFINNYFNNSLEYNGGTSYSMIETLQTDTTSFCHPYTFLYPAGTAPDYSIDRLAPYNTSIGEPNYYQILAYDLRQKLYKSTATAYTPPETKDGKSFFRGKTYMSTTNFSAYRYPAQRGKSVADSTANQYYRAAYLREIMKFFGMARTLVVNDDGVNSTVNSKIDVSLSRLGIEYSYLRVSRGNNGPSLAAMIPFSAVLWYTSYDTVAPLTPTDTVNLKDYFELGGSVILSGENAAQSFGTITRDTTGENHFLRYYFRADYDGARYADSVFLASPDGAYYYNTGARLFAVERTKSQDIVYPIEVSSTNPNIHVDTLYYYAFSKASVPAGIAAKLATHTAILFPFAIDSIINRTNLDSIMSVTFTKYLGYNLHFVPTETEAMDISFSTENGSIYFKVSVNSSRASLLLLKRNGKETDREYADDQKICILSSDENYGNFSVELLDADGNLIFAKPFNIDKSASAYRVFIKDGVLFINGEGKIADEIMLTDICGRTIMKIYDAEGEAKIEEYRRLSPGAYFLLIKKDRSTERKKLIKI